MPDEFDNALPAPIPLTAGAFTNSPAGGRNLGQSFNDHLPAPMDVLGGGTPPIPPGDDSEWLLENGDSVLLESSDELLLEA